MLQHPLKTITQSLLVLILGFLFLGMEAFASSKSRQSTIVVLPLKRSQINPDVTSALDEVLMDGISRSRRYHKVFGQSDMAAMIELASNKQVLGCDTTACMAEIAGAMGADLVLTGHVSRLGKKMLLILKIIDPLKSDVVARAKVIEDYDESDLLDLIEGGIEGIHQEFDSYLKTSGQTVGDTSPSILKSTSGPANFSTEAKQGIRTSTQSAGGSTMTIPLSIWGGALVAAGIGAYFGSQASKAKSDLDQIKSQIDYAQTINEGENAQTMANILFGVSATAALTGLGWWLLMGSGDSESVARNGAVVMAPDYVGVKLWFEL